MTLQILRSRVRRWRRPSIRAQGSTRPAGGKGYNAFISYSRAKDQAVASAIRDGLHQFARPWYRLRALRVFRDEASLSANPGLWPSIERALADSWFFVLLASPEATESDWIRREIEYWLEHRQADRLLLVLTGGSLTWDAETGDYDPERSDALPAALRGVFGDEPRHVDLRWAHERAGPADDRLKLRHSDFRDVVVQLAAPMHGRSRDEMDGEDVRQHRRTRWSVGWVVLVLVVLAMIAGIFAVVANRNANVAQERLQEVSSRQLASQALEQREGALDLALLLAVEAWRTEPTVAARSSLFTVAQEAGGGLERFLRIQPGDPVPFSLETLAVSPDGRRAAASHWPGGEYFPGSPTPTDGRIYVWSLEQAQPWARVLDSGGEPSNVSWLAFGADGRFLLARHDDGGVRLWDLDTGKHRDLALPQSKGQAEVSVRGRVFVVKTGDATVRFVDALTGRDLGEQRGTLFALTLDGRSAVGTTGAGELVLWDLATGGRTRAVLAESGDGPFHAVATDVDGRTLAVLAGTGRDRALVFDAHAGTALMTVPAPAGNALTAVAPHPHGDGVAVATEDGRVLTVRTDGTHGPDTVLPDDAGEISRLTYSVSGEILVASVERHELTAARQHVIEPAQGTLLETVQADHLVVGPDERYAVGWDGGDLVIVDLWPGTVALSTPIPLWNAALSPDRELLATAGGTGVHLWDLRSGDPTPIALPGTLDRIFNVAFDRSGERLIGVGVAGAASVWDVRAARSPGILEPVMGAADAVYATVGPDGRSYAFEDASGSVTFRDMRTGDERPAIDLPPDQTLSALAFAPDGAHLVVTTSGTTSEGDPNGTGTAWVWQVTDGVTAGQAPSAEDVAFSGDGRRLVTPDFESSTAVVRQVEDLSVVTEVDLGAFDLTPTLPFPSPPLKFALDHHGEYLAATDAVGRTIVWEVSTGEPVMDCDGLIISAKIGSTGSSGVAFSPTEPVLAVASQDEVIRLLDVGDCTVRRTLDASGTWLAFSPDGSLLATYGPLRLWDTATLEPVGGPLVNATAQVTFTSDGRYLLARDNSGEIHRWPLAERLLAERACTLAGRNLTPAEWARFQPLGEHRATCPDLDPMPSG